jgi:DnaJ-domain-containing protein 1
MEIEAVLILVFLVFYLIWAVIKGLYRLLTGAARREREKQQRRLDELQQQEQERERQEELRRIIVEAAKQQFEQVVMDGYFPSEEVLAVLADCDSDIPINLKEGVEELLYGRCSLHPMAFGAAVRLIQQRQRTDGRAKARAASANGHGSEPTGSVTQAEAFELLGVDLECSPKELTKAYHRKISEWHPDKLVGMADELKDYATRRTARINEAYDRLKQQSAQAS